MLRRGLALGGGLIAPDPDRARGQGLPRRPRATARSATTPATSPRSSKRPNRPARPSSASSPTPASLSVTDFVDRGQRRPQRDGQLRRRGSTASAPPATWATPRTRSSWSTSCAAARWTEIADKMSTALGDAGAEQGDRGDRQADAEAARRRRRSTQPVVRPEIDGVLADNGIEGSDVPKSVFLPDGTKWLDESAVSAALGAVSGSSTGEARRRPRPRPDRRQRQRHRTGRRRPTAIAGEETPEVEVEVAEPGRIDRERDHRLGHRRRRQHAAGRRSTASAPAKPEPRSIPLTPTPSGEVTLEVEVETGARRAGHRKQRSQLHRRLRIGHRPSAMRRSPTSDRPEPSPRTPCGEAAARERVRAAADGDDPRRDPRRRARRGRPGAGAVRELDRGLGAQHPRHPRLRGRAR